jgi:hypothetical protein
VRSSLRHCPRAGLHAILVLDIEPTIYHFFDSVLWHTMSYVVLIHFNICRIYYEGVWMGVTKISLNKFSYFEGLNSQIGETKG